MSDADKKEDVADEDVAVEKATLAVDNDGTTGDKDGVRRRGGGKKKKKHGRKKSGDMRRPWQRRKGKNRPLIGPDGRLEANFEGIVYVYV